MEHLAAFLRAIKMYVIIGLVATAVHAVAIQPPAGATRWERVLTVFWEVVSWPRPLVGADRATGLLPNNRRPLLSSVLSGPRDSAATNRWW
jgi:hypothetical protein